MDIAKIRKKAKEIQQPDSAAAAAEQVPPAAEATTGVTSRPGEERAAEGQAKREDILPHLETTDAILDLLTFNLENEEYAFKIHDIQEILKPQRITRIPKAQPYLLGITSLRGKIIPIIDLRKMLLLKGNHEVSKRKQKILILNGTRGAIGAVIDRVIGVVQSPLSKIVETPPHLLESEMKFIEGVAVMNGRFISILRAEEVSLI